MNHELAHWDQEVITQSSCRDSVYVSYLIPLPGTPLIVPLQVASSDQGFGNTPTDAPYHYHSIYDSQMWQEVYADPGFYKHVCCHTFILVLPDLTCD